MQPSIPSPLKWLAEKKARELHRAQRFAESAEESRIEAERLLNRANRHEASAQSSHENVAGLDRGMLVYAAEAQAPFDEIDPSKIRPVNGWQGKYGKRGRRKDYLIAFLKTNAPMWMTTDIIQQELIDRFGVVIQTPNEKERWRSSFKASLKLLRQEGFVESLPPLLRGGRGPLAMARWRWKCNHMRTLSELREQEDEYCA